MNILRLLPVLRNYDGCIGYNYEKVLISWIQQKLCETLVYSAFYIENIYPYLVPFLYLYPACLVTAGYFHAWLFLAHWALVSCTFVPWMLAPCWLFLCLTVPWALNHCFLHICILHACSLLVISMPDCSLCTEPLFPAHLYSASFYILFFSGALVSCVANLKNVLELEEWTTRNKECSQWTNRKRQGP
jgi:hypothetical protein